MTYNIDDEFAELDKYYPGSRRVRREPKPKEASDSEVTWDSSPIRKMHKGVETEFFLTTALAQALGKSVISIRLWERKGYIPKAPFRLPGRKNDTRMTGKRVYTRELIEIAVEEFAKRDLLDSSRVEWKYLDDLTIALYERWNATL